MSKRTEYIILFLAFIVGVTLQAWATDAELTATNCYDAGMSRWGNNGHRNCGGNQGFATHPTDPEPVLMKWDLSSLGSGITVTAVCCSIYTGYGSGTPKAHIIGGLMTTDWTEGVEVNDTVSAGNPGCTYSYATDGPPSGAAGSNTGWAASLFGTGDYTVGTRDSALGPVNGWLIFDSSALNADIENWANGTTSNYGWAIWCTESAGTRQGYEMAESATAAYRPRMWVTYTSGGAVAQTGQVIIIGGN